MPAAPDKILENVDFVVKELLEAPADERLVLLENVAKALTRRLLNDEPGIGAREGLTLQRQNGPLNTKAAPSAMSANPSTWLSVIGWTR